MRLIDADDVLELLNLMYDNQEDKDDPYNVGVMGAINYIKHKAPSIEIIRCGECKYWDDRRKDDWWSKEGACTIISRLGDAIYRNHDDFCSRGERSSDEID